MTSRRSNKSESMTEVLDGETAVVDGVAESVDEAPLECAEVQAVHEDEFGAEHPAVGSAGDAIRNGAAHARATVGEVIPGVARLVRKTVYGGFYCASYGVVFAALSVARLVPTNNVMGEALRAGAEAARHDVEHHVEDVDDVTADDAVVPA